MMTLLLLPLWTQIELPSETPETVTLVSLLVFLGLIALGTFIMRWLVFRFVPPLLARHSPLWAGILDRRRVLRYLYLLVPGSLTSWLVRLVPGIDVTIQDLIVKGATIFTLAMGVALVSSILLAYGDYYEQHYDFAKELPIKTVIQSAIALAVTLGVLAITAVMLDLPLISLAGIVAALLAVVAYMFKEPILGFAASLQLLANRMLAIGDWIEIPAFQANGRVEDINITSTKIRNWDNSTVNVPTYALIQNAFQNWHSMHVLEARRVEWPVTIDQDTVRFASEALVTNSLAKIQVLYENLGDELRDNDGFLGIKPYELEARSQLTNLDLYTAYSTYYIAGHPKTRGDYSIYMRQGDPGPQGLPLNTYFFTTACEFVPFYAVSREIFGHLLASLPEFGLRAFQVLGQQPEQNRELQT